MCVGPVKLLLDNVCQCLFRQVLASSCALNAPCWHPQLLCSGSYVGQSSSHDPRRTVCHAIPHQLQVAEQCCHTHLKIASLGLPAAGSEDAYTNIQQLGCSGLCTDFDGNQVGDKQSQSTSTQPRSFFKSRLPDPYPVCIIITQGLPEAVKPPALQDLPLHSPVGEMAGRL